MSILSEVFLQIFIPIFDSVKVALVLFINVLIILYAVLYACKYFRADPTSDVRWIQWYKDNKDNYSTFDEAVKSFDNQRTLAFEYKTRHFREYRRERSKRLYEERQDAYRYFESMKKLGI